ncbi:aspartate aminotransferase [Enterococcus florum]|uniref:Aspartate aminotransferase n=1 Tax=Enterococcus florum TaxID=2480627 RepID=A0A4P5P474_9ENTE|nr:helix-turn-helix domain-containing protein [Enterococcus florum]GCF92587.1 aspartate aminotransferase [Enterococcus florum]
MRTLLSTSIYRKIMLIEFLDRFASWCPTKDVTTYIDCSPKTLLTDIDYINEFWGEYIFVEYSKFQGVRLNNLASNKLANVYALIFQECDEFQFIEKLLYRPNEDADFWINELFMSEASFYRMANNIEGFLENRGLTLERNPFRITAKEERWVRFFYTEYFKEAYGVNDWPFEYTNQQETYCFIMRTSTDFDVSLDDREIQLCSFLLMVSFIRMGQGFFISEEEYDKPDDVIDQVIQYSEPLAKRLLAHSPYSLRERWYKGIGRTVYYEFYAWDNHQQEIRIHDKIETFLTKLSQAVDFPLLEEDKSKIIQQMKSWYLQYNLYPYNQTLLFDNQKRMAREILNVYPTFSAIVSMYLEDIERKKPELWTSIRMHDILVLLVKEWTNLPIQLEQLRKKVSIMIVSNLGKKHAEMLKDFLYSQYGDKVILEVYPSPTLFSDEDDFAILDDYDIVISNNPIEKYHGEHCLIVNNFFSASDRESIYELIVSIQKEASEKRIHQLGIAYFQNAKNIYSFLHEDIAIDA